nr:hypothetical protein [uncultured Rhodopila sp.]
MLETESQSAAGYADLLIIDDMIPCGFSPFRTVEYEHYLSFFNARLLSMEGWHLRYANGDFVTQLRQLSIRPDLKERIVPFSSGWDMIGRLAYVSFLGNATRLLSYFEKRQLPFIFQLYPGGGFEINQPETDEKLRRVLLSDLCRKVIVTQRLTRDYITDRIGCDPAKIKLIFGGVFESRGGFDFHKDKRIFGRDKNTIDLCFVAHKYENDLITKGYDQFVNIALALSQDDPRLRFHVVGDYAAGDIALGSAEDKFTFYGRQRSDFFDNFYPTMDIIVSVNRPLNLASGAFDGFPTGGCIEAGFHGVLNCINDPLGLNPIFTTGHDIIILDFDTEKSVESLRQILKEPADLYRLAYENWRKFHEVFGTDQQLWARTKLIAEEILRHNGLIVPPALGKSMLDVERALMSAPLDKYIAELEVERTRLENVYQVLDDRFRNLENDYRILQGHYLTLEDGCRKQEGAYRVLENHYFALEAERKRLQAHVESYKAPVQVSRLRRLLRLLVNRTLPHE